MSTILHTRLYCRFREIQSNLGRNKLHRTNQDFNFLGGTFSNRDDVKAPRQIRRERKPQYLKRYTPIHFHINGISAIRPVNRNKLRFSSIKINEPLSASVNSVSQIRFKFSSRLYLLTQIRCLNTLTVESSIISIDSNITDVIRKFINV